MQVLEFLSSFLMFLLNSFQIRDTAFRLLVKYKCPFVLRLANDPGYFGISVFVKMISIIFVL